MAGELEMTLETEQLGNWRRHRRLCGWGTGDDSEDLVAADWRLCCWAVERSLET